MSDCYCDYDPPEFYNATIRTARKPHKCDECDGAIGPREKYEYVSAKWNGWLSQFHTCERCINIRTWVRNNVPCFCFAHGGSPACPGTHPQRCGSGRGRGGGE